MKKYSLLIFLFLFLILVNASTFIDNDSTDFNSGIYNWNDINWTQGEDYEKK